MTPALVRSSFLLLALAACQNGDGGGDTDTQGDETDQGTVDTDFRHTDVADTVVDSEVETDTVVGGDTADTDADTVVADTDLGADTDTGAVDTDTDVAPPDTDTGLVDTVVIDTQIVDTEVVDTVVVDTQIADTVVADTQVVDTVVADTQVVDTVVVDTQVADTVIDTLVTDTYVFPDDPCFALAPARTAVITTNTTVATDGFAGEVCRNKTLSVAGNDAIVIVRTGGDLFVSGKRVIVYAENRSTVVVLSGAEVDIRLVSPSDLSVLPNPGAATVTTTVCGTGGLSPLTIDDSRIPGGGC